LFLVLLAVSGAAVAAEKYPAKPIRMIVPFAPGGISDIFARIAADKITAATGQTVVVDNRAGASGNIGTALAARAPNDGYTLLFVAPAFATNPSLYKQPGYDPLRDFVPVIHLASATNLLVASPVIGVRSVKELIAAAKAKPGALNYGSGGVGTSGQLAAELLQSAAHIKLVHVPYKGAGPAMTALLGNEVQLMFSPIILAAPHVQAHRLVPLAVTSAKRSPAFPDVPTIAEAAIPGFDVTSWFGIVAPAGTPAARVKLLHDAVARALATPEVANRFAARGAEAAGGTNAAFGAYIRKEVTKWARVIHDAGIKAH
jgi:tripartite-type tricarboxylate transporter receptor subunit TctC